MSAAAINGRARRGHDFKSYSFASRGVFDREPACRPADANPAPYGEPISLGKKVAAAEQAVAYWAVAF